ncbi:unnamed protein product [Dovyalis caffra]|uniref:TF-B3 domain-containing protein n=1 Tax=Dovyalis caffra TaxID=77055 RepID=A0AAV1SV51_9ROSI|nr:unnamed protein product [Dovyalis caffra]
MEIFTKKLNNTDIERRLLLPENYLKDFPIGHEANLEFKDEDGKVWTFRCRVPPGSHSKPALFGDWFLFVRIKGLRIGDVIIIVLDEEKDIAAGGHFKIKLINKMKAARLVSIVQVLRTESFSFCNACIKAVIPLLFLAGALEVAGLCIL